MAKTSAAEAPKAPETETQTPAAEAQKAPETVVESPKPKTPKFRVTLGDDSQEIEAVNESEAWAKFCDMRKKWPSPRTPGRTIEKVE